MVVFGNVLIETSVANEKAIKENHDRIKQEFSDLQESVVSSACWLSGARRKKVNCCDNSLQKY